MPIKLIQNNNNAHKLYKLCCSLDFNFMSIVVVFNS
jgi:hypothetical protein